MQYFDSHERVIFRPQIFTRTVEPAMRIKTKGQVTIRQEIRNQLGLLPQTDVEFEMAGDHVRISKARARPEQAPVAIERSKCFAALRIPA